MTLGALSSRLSQIIVSKDLLLPSSRVYLIILLCVLGLLFFTPAARAQDSVPAPPVNSSVDINGVDLISGKLTVSEHLLTIGQPGEGGISYSRHLVDTGWRDSLIGTVNNNGGCYVISIGANSVDCNSMAAAGASFTHIGGAIYRYTTRDGTVADFSTAFASLVPVRADFARIVSITYPNGERLDFHNAIVATACIGPPPPNCTNTNVVLLRSVTSNRGYQIRYTDTGQSVQTGSYAINMTVDYCNPTAATCSSPSQPVQNAITLGINSTYTFNGSTTTIQRPGGATFTYSLDGARRVTQVANGAETWAYSYSDNGDIRTTNVSLLGQVRRRVTSRISTSRVLTDTSDPNGLNLTITYQYDGSNRIERVTQPEGDYIHYTYDGRGNVTQARAVARPGSGQPDIVTSASYPPTCNASNFRICNRPTSITDGRNYSTDYTYDAAHGGVLTVTQPSPDGVAVRPQTRFAYEARTARYRNASGQIVDAPSTVYVLTSSSACASGTAPSCIGTASEARTTTEYGLNQSGVANNLLPTKTIAAAGDGSVVAETITGYDAAGNETSVDGPRTGAGDTTIYRYNAARRLVGVIQPDPDGGGALPRPAVRTTYNGVGDVTLVEVGSVTGTSDTHWNNFALLEQNASTYNAQGRLTRKTLSAGGSTLALMQQSYDSLGRLECAALRMNPAAFGSPPGSACSLGAQGSDGPDRIARTLYDGAGRVSQIQAAYGTSAQETIATYAYRPNGVLDRVTDASNNRSDFGVDGFNRRLRWYLPSSTLGAGVSNPNDYEEYGYDANGNVTSLRLRSGETISYTYDRLNRLVLKDMPGGGASDVVYAYDNFGQMLSARFAPSGAPEVSFGYDALGRVTSETSYGRTLSHLYDTAGNRTRLTYPDGNWIEYTYDQLNRVDQIRENGATSGQGLLVDYAYDVWGRLSGAARGNSANASLSYDAASRIQSFAQSFPVSADNLTLTYARNPADQTTTRTPNNSAYAYAPPTLGTISYTPDGLNRYTNVAGVSFAYDGRGNLTADGARAFCYDLENRLVATRMSAGAIDCASGSGTQTHRLRYDPLGRLRELETVGTATTQFLYDGDALVAEYLASSGVMQHRYVHGGGIDDPVVWYQGAGLTNATRTWLHTDELGSVIAVSDHNGDATPYAYDAYGRPANDNWSGSRFRYTGQIALYEIRLYHYKARVYDPVLGRFLQVDPVGYGAGLNLYAYVGNDPVNLIDPTGLDATCPSNPCGPPVDFDVIVIEGRRGCDAFCQSNRAWDIAGQFYNRHQGTIDTIAGFIPGYDVARCIGQGCSGTDWALAVVSIVPVGRAGALLFRVGRACFCVTGDTLVATPDGLVPIAEIEIGDLVLAVDPETGEVAAKPVTALIRPPPQPTYALEAGAADGSNESFRASAEHPWRVAGRGWINTQDLRVGDELQTASGATLSITSLALSGQVEQTYTLEVAAWHTYLVGNSRIVVHNGGFCSIAARYFRRNLERAFGPAPAGAAAHHVFPQKFRSDFRALGINIDLPAFGAWWNATDHGANARAYNEAWETFFASGNRTAEEALEFGRNLSARYGFNVNY